MQRASQILGRISAAPRSRKQPNPMIDAEQVACASWARAVGPRIVRGHMVVEVEDAVWQRNLFFLSRQILSNLAKDIGPGMVTDLEFRIIPRRREPQREISSASHVCEDESDAIGDLVLRRLYRAARFREVGRKESA